MDVNDNQPRGLLLCCSDSISFCYQGIGIILFCSLSKRKVSIFVPKLEELIFGAWVWLLAGTHSRALTHALTRTHTHTHTHTYTHTSFTLPSAEADVPTWYRVPGQRFTLHTVHVALSWPSIQVRHITSAERRVTGCELVSLKHQYVEYNQP